MNYRIINLLIGIAFSILVTAQTTAKPNAVKSYPLHLKIHVEGLSSGTCLLANYFGNQQYIQDSVKVNANGWFEFKSTKPRDGGIYLIVLPDKTYFEIILDENQQFTIETEKDNFVTKMKVTSSTENQYFYEYLNFLNDRQKEMELVKKVIDVTNSKDSIEQLNKKTLAIDNTVKNYKREYYKTKHPTTFMAKVLAAMDEPDQIPYSDFPKKTDGSIDSTFNYKNFKKHYWDGMDFTDDRLIRTPVFAYKLKFYLDKLTPQQPDSIMAACDWLIEKTRSSKELFKYTVYYCTYTYESSKIMGYDAIFVHIVNSYYINNQTYWLSKEQQEKIIKRANTLSNTLLGKKATNINLPDTNNRLVPLYSINAKYTVVIFWDPTCSHCTVEIPHLKTYYDSLRKANVSLEVYAIIAEADLTPWRAYIKKNQLTWVNVASLNLTELNNLKKYYDVYSTPTMYLLDEQKIIIGKRLDTKALIGFLNHTLTKK